MKALWHQPRLMHLLANALFGLALLGLLALAAGWLAARPIHTLRTVRIDAMPGTELRHVSSLLLGQAVRQRLAGSFFSVDLDRLRAGIEQVPWVRKAAVRREYPGLLHVELEEHDAVAYWGPESGSALVNSQGEVFEANVGDVEQEDLPRLSGPEGSSQEVLAMYGVVAPVFKTMGLELEELELNGRGGWRAKLANNAVVQLGGGDEQELLQRTRRFARTLAQVAAQYQRRVDALESADLRHVGGYALKLRGVTTTAGVEATPAVRR